MIIFTTGRVRIAPVSERSAGSQDVQVCSAKQTAISVLCTATLHEVAIIVVVIQGILKDDRNDLAGTVHA